METKKVPYFEMKFSCEKCAFNTMRKSQWERHVLTLKHKTQKMETLGNQKSSKWVCVSCDKQYKNRSGLWKHKQKCTGKNKENEENDNVEIVEISEPKNEKNVLLNENQELKNMIRTMMKENSEVVDLMKEQNKTIQELAPKVGNNNNNSFNLNFFLNEQCKDALNITDFVESLQIQMEDLEDTKDYGLVKGISSVFMRGLKQLNMYQRPIHCTDIKRETLYIKDKDVWEKDDKSLLKKSIGNIADKQRKSIQEWQKNNPDWQDTEEGQHNYLVLVKNTMNDVENNVCEGNKIIKTIVKGVVIDK